MHIFTYGTLMFPEVWTAVAGRMFDTIAARLDGYAIFRVEGAVFPGIVAATAESSVPGVVYFDVDDAAVTRLDRFEDDFYVRQTVTIRCDDGREWKADAYVVPPEHGQVLATEPWTRESFIASGGLEQFIHRFAGFARIARKEGSS